MLQHLFDLVLGSKIGTKMPVEVLSALGEADYVARRKQLRKQRRIRIWQRLWQLTFITGLTGGLLWVAMLPEWQLRSPAQIEIEGNNLLSPSVIKKALPIKYPQSIFQIQPQAIATHLENSAPVFGVVVSRTIFPSKLTIQIRERLPIANSTRKGQMGFLDAEGIWIPVKAYPANITKPKLVVLEPSDRPIANWSNLYRQISQSQVKVNQVDARDESNLVLNTELGLVYFGAYQASLFSAQLETLDRMRNLPEKLNSQALLHIDLTQPSNPVLEMNLNKNDKSTLTGQKEKVSPNLID
jgi:cell division protein FtsQ